MKSTRPAASEFRTRLCNRDHVLGTFIKTPTTHATEIIGHVGFDFVIIDQEHAPFDRQAIDMACLAGLASNIAALVRVAEPTPSSILSVLDCGAAGVLVPHVDSPAIARTVAEACRYRNGSRGFSTTTRAGNFGAAGMADHIEAQDSRVTCVAMIEDLAALGHLDALVQQPGIDAFFIGRGDLTAALGAERMQSAVKEITAAASANGMTTMALVSSREDARDMRELGVTAFVYSNDQSLMRAAAVQALADFSDPTAW